MSFNILREDLGGEGHLWADRKQAVLKMIDVNYPTLIGLQECSWTIREDILKADSRRKAIGNSVNNEESGYTKTSSNSIIYRSDIYEVVKSGQFWFSDTPDKVSNVWTAGYQPKPRVCTWARFKVKNTGKEFYHFNIHLHNGSAYNSSSDNYIGDSRTRSLNLLFDRIGSENTSDLPVIITGDFNAELSHAMFEPFADWLYDARSTAPVSDTRATYHGFGLYSTKIDHIFYTGLEPLEYRTINKTYEGVTYISDHYPIAALFELTGSANPDDPQTPGNYGDLTEENFPLDDYNEPPSSNGNYGDLTEENYPLQ